MKTRNPWIALAAALVLPAPAALAALFTNDTTIVVGDPTYEGNDIVVSRCTLMLGVRNQ